MPGLLIVGMHHGAGEADVALAAAESLGAEPVSLLEETGSSPLIAARHRGDTLDPQDLIGMIAAAGEDVVVSLGGGLLAPVTPRYSVRDLAADIGLPVVLAARIGPDAVALLRLGAEACRGAGLAVAAFVLTGWPGDPNRVQLDERALLGEVAAKVPTAALGDPRGWDPQAWVQTTAAAIGPHPPQAVVAAGVVEAALDPYDEWEMTPTGDPRHTPRPRIMEAMLAIVAAEGPMRATRAYALYNRASGGKKLTSIARAPLSSAVHWLGQERKIVMEDVPGQEDQIVRLPDTPAVRVRSLGPRTLEEVPLDEIAELMRRLRSARGISGESDLKRAVLSTYGLIRMTAKADEYLGLAYGLMVRD